MMILSRFFTPTSNKRLNELVGFLYFVLACLLFLALVSYSPLDPSLNTAAAVSTRHPAHNWVGVLGALASDLLLQTGGIAVFLFPLFVMLLGWRWFRSLKIDAASAKVIGALVLFLFVSALLGSLPWHWHWLRVIPAEGLSGRILADVMVRYLNRSGAYIVCLALVAVGLYLATRFSFGALQLWFQTRFSFLHVVVDRYRDWRSARAKAKAQREMERRRRAKAIVVEAQFVPRKPAAETSLVRLEMSEANDAASTAAPPRAASNARLPKLPPRPPPRPRSPRGPTPSASPRQPCPACKAATSCLLRRFCTAPTNAANSMKSSSSGWRRCSPASVPNSTCAAR